MPSRPRGLLTAILISHLTYVVAAPLTREDPFYVAASAVLHRINIASTHLGGGIIHALQTTAGESNRQLLSALDQTESHLRQQADAYYQNSTQQSADLQDQVGAFASSALSAIGQLRRVTHSESQRARRERQSLLARVQGQQTAIHALQTTVDSYLVRLNALHAQGDFTSRYVQAIGNHLRVWIT